MVLHELKQRVDRLLTEIAFGTGRARKSRGFVDEQNTVQRLPAFLYHFWRRLTDIADHHARTIDFHQMAGTQGFQRSEDSSDGPRDLRFSDPWWAGENHVHARRCDRQALLAPFLFD